MHACGRAESERRVRETMRNLKVRLAFALLAVMVVLISVQVVFAKPKVTSTKQLSEATFAVITGTTCGPDTEKNFPNAKIDYYNTMADILTVLRTEKADATVTELGLLRYIQPDNQDIVMLGDVLAEVQLAPVFPKTDKGQALCDEYNAFVKKLRDDGTLKEIEDNWFSGDKSRQQVLDYENLPDTNGTLRMAVDASLVPFAFVMDNRIVGYDVDVAARFCKERGYRLEIDNMAFDSILAAVQT